MNKRIIELAIESGLPTALDYHQRRTLKFAELIVNECVTVLNNRFMGDMNREDLEVRRCIADVKKHFGENDE